MALIHRQDFSGGWNPSQDLVNGNPKALVRMDNLVLDDQGILSLRKGSVTISGSAPLHPIGASTYRVSNFFTCTLTNPRDNITRRERYVSIDNAVYRSESVGYWSQIASNFGGTGDIQFAEMFGQVFETRGVTHYKNDGDATRWWGLQAPTETPAVWAEPSNQVEISDGTGWQRVVGQEPTAEEGHDGTPEGATGLLPNADDSFIAARYTFGPLLDLSRYPDGEESTDLDQIEFWVYITEPGALNFITIAFDVNADDDAQPFAEDYYFYDVFGTPGVSTTSQATSGLSGQEFRERIQSIYGVHIPALSTLVPPNWQSGLPHGSQVGGIAGAAGWRKFSVPKIKFNRVGNTTGRDWSTVRYVQVTAQYSVNNQGITIDDFRMLGGAQHPLTGEYKCRAVLYADYGTHIVRSGPSPVSEPIKLQSNGLWVRIYIGDQTTSPLRQHAVGEPGDPQTGVEFYLLGDGLSAYYRFKVQPALQGTVTVQITTSAEDAAVANVTLDETLAPPPQDIIGLVSNHFRRMLVLTENKLYPSQNGNPESFPEKFAISLGTNVIAYWIVRHQEEILLGTNIDIFRLEGSGEEYPDGTINYSLRRLNISEPPTSEAVVTEGNMLVYLAADGWRLFKGLSSESLRGSVDLLYKGHTRYGVGPASVGTTMGRFRAGLFNGNFYALTPEVVGAQFSNAVWVYSFLRQAWYRFVYPTTLCALYREPDGELLAGDTLGCIWRMEVGDNGDVRYQDLAASGETNPYLVTGQAIPVQAWTVSDSNNDPLSFKDPFDFRIECDTGNASMAVALYSDETSSWTSTVASSIGTLTTVARDLDTMEPFRRAQLRLSGSFYSLRVASYSLVYRPRPIKRLRWDSGYTDFGAGTEMVWVRQVMLKTRGAGNGADINYEIWFDGHLRASGTIDVTTELSGVETHYSVPVGRFVHGRQMKLVLYSAGTDINDAFEPYWAEVTFHGTSTKLDKKVLTARAVEA